MKKRFAILFCLVLAIMSFLSSVYFFSSTSDNVSKAEEFENVTNWGNKVDTALVTDSIIRSYLVQQAQNKGIPTTSFFDKMLSDIEEINLSEFNIKSLEGLEYFYFDSLKTLNLSSNAISIIPENTFYNMKNLETLDLSNNSLSSFNATLYAKNINLKNNLLTSVEICDNYLEVLDISNNNIATSENITVLQYNSETKLYQDLPHEQYYILAYYNYMAGNNKYDNAYLGIQYYKDSYKDKTGKYDYDMFMSFYIYVYPLKEVCVGKDSANNLIYKQVRMLLYMLNNETNEYEHVKTFIHIPVEGKSINTIFDQYKTISGIYKLEFVVDNDENEEEEYSPIYQLNENYEKVTEKDYNDMDVPVVDSEYRPLTYIVRPYAAQNVYLKIKSSSMGCRGDEYKCYPVSTPELVGPLDVELYVAPEMEEEGGPVTFKYIVDGKGAGEKNGQQIRFEGNTIYLDTTGCHVIKVWICQNGVESEFKTMNVNMRVYRQMTFSNWFFLIVGLLLIAGGFTFYMIMRNKKEVKKEINDFEW